MPSHRIEETLAVVTARLGIPSQFFSLPTVILAAFDDPESRSTGLVRVQPGDIHLEKLVLLDEVLKDLLRGEATLAQAAARVEQIERRPDPYGPVLRLLAFATSSAASACLFGAGPPEVAASALLGAVVGALGLSSRSHPGLARIREPLAAFVVAFFAQLAAARITPIAVNVVALSSLVVLLPGLALTLAIAELAEQSLVSGTVRFVTAGVVLLELIFGVALGRAAARPFGAALPIAEGGVLPAWTLGLALLLAPCAFTVLFRARGRDAVPMLVTSVLGFVGTILGRKLLGVDLGSFVGALAVGLSSSVYARWRDRPVAVAIVPGILLLVPGSIGFQGLTFLLERDVTSGVDAAFRMLFVAASIVAGLLISNIALPPRRPF